MVADRQRYRLRRHRAHPSPRGHAASLGHSPTSSACPLYEESITRSVREAASSLLQCFSASNGVCDLPPPIITRSTRIAHFYRHLSFDWKFTLREIMEVAVQTYQAYRISWSVARVWINQLTTATILLNCALALLLSIVLRRKTTLRHTLCLVLGLVLYFTCSIVVPFLILLPYIAAYDSSLEGFRNEQYYDDVWQSMAFVEARQVLVAPIFDGILTALPHLSLLYCLGNLKACTRSADLALNKTLGPSSSVAPACTVLTGESKNPENTPLPHTRTRLLILAHAGLIIWGVVVAGVYVDAQARYRAVASGGSPRLLETMCANRLRAWLVKRDRYTV